MIWEQRSQRNTDWVSSPSSSHHWFSTSELLLTFRLLGWSDDPSGTFRDSLGSEFRKMRFGQIKVDDKWGSRSVAPTVRRRSHLFILVGRVWSNCSGASEAPRLDQRCRDEGEDKHDDGLKWILSFVSFHTNLNVISSPAVRPLRAVKVHPVPWNCAAKERPPRLKGHEFR